MKHEINNWGTALKTAKGPNTFRNVTIFGPHTAKNRTFIFTTHPPQMLFFASLSALAHSRH